MKNPTISSGPQGRLDAKPGQYLTFMLHNQEYGVPIGTVREINRVVEITLVPQTPFFVAGVMNLRGRVIPVIDLRLKFGFEATPYTRHTCIVVIEGIQGEFGAIVDAVTGVVNFTTHQLEPAPTIGADAHLGFIMGMAKIDKNVVIVVNIIEIFSKEQLLTETEKKITQQKAAA